MKIAEQLGSILKANRLTMGCAESCTGGNIAHLITSVAGSSEYFTGAIVSYTNEVKIDLLGVSSETLEKHGAVSREVVGQMVQGARRALKCDCAVATSGVAGPGGGSTEKPVGTVWIAASINEETVTRCYHFGDERSYNILASSNAALELLLEMLKAKNITL